MTTIITSSIIFSPKKYVNWDTRKCLIWRIFFGLTIIGFVIIMIIAKKNSREELMTDWPSFKNGPWLRKKNALNSQDYQNHKPIKKYVNCPFAELTHLPLMQTRPLLEYTLWFGWHWPVDRSVQDMVVGWDQNSCSDPYPNHWGDCDPPQDGISKEI